MINWHCPKIFYYLFNSRFSHKSNASLLPLWSFEVSWFEEFWFSVLDLAVKRRRRGPLNSTDEKRRLFTAADIVGVDCPLLLVVLCPLADGWSVKLNGSLLKMRNLNKQTTGKVINNNLSHSKFLQISVSHFIITAMITKLAKAGIFAFSWRI